MMSPLDALREIASRPNGSLPVLAGTELRPEHRTLLREGYVELHDRTGRWCLSLTSGGAALLASPPVSGNPETALGLHRERLNNLAHLRTASVWRVLSVAERAVDAADGNASDAELAGIAVAMREAVGRYRSLARELKAELERVHEEGAE